MKKSSIEYTVNHDLCLGCGICADACPTNSIVMNVKDGEWRPQINNSTCLNAKGCNKCFKVCSGVGLDIKQYSESLYSEAKVKDKYIGRYEKLYTGWSCDLDIRRKAN